MSDSELELLLGRYTNDEVAWDAAVGTDATRANKVFDRLHLMAKDLGQTPSGREGLLGLTRHNVPGVRLLAATECLPWSPEAAIQALEEIEQGTGLHAVSAKYTLKSYRAGSLNLTW